MSFSPAWRPMPLLRIPTPFNHPEWLFELKHDGFRALAVIDGSSCQLISRNGHVFSQWPELGEELTRAVRTERAVLDGEITCVQPDGRSDFRALMFRRGWPVFYAFDALSIGDEDLRGLPLRLRKTHLRNVMPSTDTRLRYVDHVEERGAELFGLACARDCEGVVGKWGSGLYRTDGTTTSWVKIKNPDYSQMEGRYELFDQRRGPARASVRRPYRLDTSIGVPVW